MNLINMIEKEIANGYGDANAQFQYIRLYHGQGKVYNKKQTDVYRNPSKMKSDCILLGLSVKHPNIADYNKDE